MRNFLFIFLIIIYCIFFSLTSYAEIISHSVNFNFSDLRFSRFNDYDVITMKNLGATARTGEPQLPVELIHLLIPLEREVEQVEIFKLKRKVLDTQFHILPVQQPEILSSPQGKNREIEFTNPDEKIYTSTSYYPERVIEYKGSGYCGGYHIASFLIYPLQYSPAARKVIFHSSIQFNIRLKTKGAQFVAHKNLTTSQYNVFKDIITNFVQNRQYLSSIKTPAVAENSNHEYQYIIITRSAFINQFQPLADWKNKKGVPAKIVTVDTIYSKYEGKDYAEKIRNFIKYARENWGTVWVLLGGDTNAIPHRTAFAMDCEAGWDPEENDIPCDLYFSDLDGNWDLNNNGIYGEVADSVDLYPDVFIGRASISNISEANTFVNKILTYEKTPPLEYQKDMLFAAEILWSEPYTNTGIGKDMIENETLPSNFYNITKLYEHNGNESKSSVLSALNKGHHIFNHDGHASERGMGTGYGSIDYNDMNNLTNGPRYTICFSIGCYPASFDRECIAEAFITNPNGGGVAFIGNSRYGWGSPGNPGYGYSDRYDSKFFKFLFKHKNFNLGKALALAKAFHIPYAQSENVYRWCMYEINLLGDPEMPVWTDMPKTTTVSYPKAIPTGMNNITITVMVNENLVAGSLVCLMQGNDVYACGHTAANGQVNLSVTPIDASTNMNVTVTASNCLPYEGSIDITSDESYMAITKCSIVDSFSNNDGLLNPGETTNLNIVFKNFGNKVAKDVTAILSSDNTLITVTNDSVYLGEISALDSVTYENAYTLIADLKCENGLVFPLSLEINASESKKWDGILPMTVSAPIISFAGLEVKDNMGGNGNGIPEPGETVKLLISILNNGLAPAQNVSSSSLRSYDSFLKIPPTHSSFGDIIQPGLTGIDSFTVIIADSCPVPSFSTLYLDISIDDSLEFPVSCQLAIGQIGFRDNIENGMGDWEIVGTATNLWHISPINSHSPSHSWYCGREEDTTYIDYNQSILYSPSFYLGANATLSFWLWFDVAIYSKWGYEGDGIYVEIFDGTAWHTLDFIGTGGALNPILMGSDWCEYIYDLSSFPPGTNAKLRFKFISDPYWDQYPERHQGVFLDDIKVTYELSTSIEEKEELAIPQKYELKQNYPNPFNQQTVIEYQIAGNKSQQVYLRIFNILGQEIKILVNKKQIGGHYTVHWDGRNEKGHIAASGIYIYQLQIGNFKEEKKLVILR